MEIKYIASFYKNDSGAIHFVRIVKDSSDHLRIEGVITYDPQYITIQKITKNELIEENTVNELQAALENSGYRPKFDDYRKVMFVQVNPKELDDMEVLDLRHYVELKLHRILSKHGSGRWIAGDLGPGGGNMLFEVSDWDKAFFLTLELLDSENLLESCLIAKRLSIAEDDWDYEIVYPVDYDGKFNHM